MGLRYLFFLKLSFSPLRSHKSHGFDNTPANCLCNHGAEDTNHFLFSCPFFVIQRATLMTSVNVILQKYNLDNLVNQPDLYLYGYRTLDSADNKQILLSTIRFIKDSQRLSV